MKYVTSILGALVALCGIFLVAGPVRSQTTEIVFDITVVRHINVSITDLAVTQTYQTATSLLKTNNSSTCNPPDVACCVTLSKSGFLSSFGVSGDDYDVIDSEAKRNAVWALTQGEVKVVNLITYPSNALGLAPDPAPTVRTAIIVNNADPDVWAHEFGHGQGLGENSGCEKYIMHPAALNTNVVTNTECDGMRTLKAPYHFGGTCAGPPDPFYSYFVPQSGSLSLPNEGAVAIASFRRCPNNEGGQSLPNSARLKVVSRDSNDSPISGIAAADICMLFNGGTGPGLQGFGGVGGDSIIANHQYNQLANCPDVRCVPADGASDANGVAYITFIGAGGVRDPLRKWGGWEGDVPVFVLGVKLDGRLTSSSFNGTYTAHVKSLDFVGGRTTAPNQGELVNSLDINPVQASSAVSCGSQVGEAYKYERDFDNSGCVNSIDLNFIKAHNLHDCDTPLVN